MQLVINSPGTFITQKDGCFQLKNEDKRFDISPQKVESIIITNKAMITSQAVVAALENNIDIIFLDAFGHPIGRIWFANLKFHFGTSNWGETRKRPRAYTEQWVPCSQVY